MITSISIATALDLVPHPEGGFYRETYRADDLVMTARGPRSSCTAILFMVAAGSPSRFHRLSSDELWLYHGGCRLELTLLLPDGRAETVVLGGAGLVVGDEATTPQALVPAGTWQAARVLPSEGVDWSLVSCVVTPGWDRADFELALRDELLVAYPDQAELIASLA